MPSNRIALALALALASVSFGQKAALCHKGHDSEGYKITPMPAPALREGFGSTTLTMTTQSAQAQAYFRQGVMLLHCFWDFEAYRAFKEAARLDPNAAMAYWGIVQSIDTYKAMADEKKDALEKIEKLLPKASDHEQYYLRAQQKQQDPDESKEYAGEMEALMFNYPEDLDAKLFFAINQGGGYDKADRPKTDTLYAITLIESILRDHPDNAAANHYLIHLLEAGPRAGRALKSADALAALAPASGHMVHMPGHIYFKLGDQERAREAFLASSKVDAEYMKREHVSTLDDWNYAHNLSYLIASDAEAGRYQEALDYAAKIDSLPANPFLAVGKPAHAITIGSAAARLHLRFGNWQNVIDHPPGIGNERLAGPAAVAFRDGILAYARGMKAVEGSQLDQAARQADALDALQWRLKSESADDEGEAKPDHVLNLLETASLDLRGNLQCAQGKTEEGFKLLQKAVEKEEEVGYGEPPQYSRPELESLGYAYLHASDYVKAREAFTKELKLRPKSGHALYGIALAYEKEGQKQEASKAFAEFLDAWPHADASLPMVQHARSRQ